MEFCTIKDAATISGLAATTWYEGAAGTDSVPRIRFGRSIRLLRSDVERFVHERISEAKAALSAPSSSYSGLGEGQSWQGPES
jgi:hypothetical protein